MGHWHRNLFTGVDQHSRCAHGRTTVVLEDGGGPAVPGDVSVQWMQAVGLDQSVERRGLAVMPRATADPLVGARGIRVLAPIGPRLSRAR